MADRKANLSIPSGVSGQERKFFESVKENLDVLIGHRGQALDRAVTFRDLVEAGVVTLPDNVVFSGTASQFSSSQVIPNLLTPPAPTSLTAAGAFEIISLTWELTQYQGHSHFELWRHTSDSLAAATMHAQLGGYQKLYADQVGGDKTFFYWIRAVNQNGVEGPFNSTAGTSGTTQPNLAFLQGALANSITSSELASALATPISNLPSNTTDELNQIRTDVAAITEVDEYSSSANYATDTMVTHSGNLYRALQSTTGNAPSGTTSDTAYWKYVGEYTSLADAVSGNTSSITAINNIDSSSTSAAASKIAELEAAVTNSSTGLTANAGAITSLTNTVNANSGSITIQSSQMTDLRQSLYLGGVTESWATGQSYQTNDLVKHSSLLYMALSAHTSDGTNGPSGSASDNAKWKYVVDKVDSTGTAVDALTTSTTATDGTVTSHGLQMTALNSAVFSDQVTGTWTDGKTYAVGDKVVYTDNKVYSAEENHTANSSNSPAASASVWDFVRNNGVAGNADSISSMQQSVTNNANNVAAQTRRVDDTVSTVYSRIGQVITDPGFVKGISTSAGASVYATHDADITHSDTAGKTRANEDCPAVIFTGDGTSLAFTRRILRPRTPDGTSGNSSLNRFAWEEGRKLRVHLRANIGTGYYGKIRVALARMNSSYSLVGDYVYVDWDHSGLSNLAESYTAGQWVDYTGVVTFPAATLANVQYGSLTLLFDYHDTQTHSAQVHISNFEAYLYDPEALSRIVDQANTFSTILTDVPDWASQTAYAVDDPVKRYGNIYLSQLAHTSYAGSNAPNFGPPETGSNSTWKNIGKHDSVGGIILSAATNTFQVSARLDDQNGVTLEQKFSAIASDTEGLEGQYTLKIDNAGHVAGIGLASTHSGSTPLSSFIVTADQFAFVPSTTASGGSLPATGDYQGQPFRLLSNGLIYYWDAEADPAAWTTDQSKMALPFVVQTANQNVTLSDGTTVTVPPGVYIAKAMISDASITSAKIHSVDADVITTGTLDVSNRIDANTIQASKLKISNQFLSEDSNGQLQLITSDGSNGIKVENLSNDAVGTMAFVKGGYVAAANLHMNLTQAHFVGSIPYEESSVGGPDFGGGGTLTNIAQVQVTADQIQEGGDYFFNFGGHVVGSASAGNTNQAFTVFVVEKLQTDGTWNQIFATSGTIKQNNSLPLTGFFDVASHELEKDKAYRFTAYGFISGINLASGKRGWQGAFIQVFRIHKTS